MVRMGHRRTSLRFQKEATMATGTVKFFNAQKGFGSSCRTAAARMCSFTSRGRAGRHEQSQ